MPDARGAFDTVMADHWAEGGGGGGRRRTVSSLTNWIDPLKRRSDRSGKRSTGLKQVKLFTEQGFAHLPICMSMTHLSLSYGPTFKEFFEDFRLNPSRCSGQPWEWVGRRFLYPLVGEMSTMLDLPMHPCLPVIEQIDGLFESLSEIFQGIPFNRIDR